ncbi:MAG: hypothetical protein FWH01_11120, partial [Oscillospiraceae bacterium]|nr:hypothetical protein [Oscillospiraceae bacterium]
GAQYYHRLDTHWNNVGAMEAYRTIMAEIERLQPGIAYDSYADRLPHARADWPGDLERMLNPASSRMDTQHYYEIASEYRSRKPIVNLDDLNIVSTSEKNDARALFFRDSFANALIPLFSNNFGEASYTRSAPFPLSRAEGGAYDFVVAEIAERNIHWIVSTAPTVPAPLRAVLADGADGVDSAYGANVVDGVDGSDDAVYGASNNLTQLLGEAPLLSDGAVKAAIFEPGPDAVTVGGARVFGCFDPAYLSDGREIRIYPVFESVDSEAGVLLVFEAFPILESEIQEQAVAFASLHGGASVPVGGGDMSDCGFSFQINDSELPDGYYILKILLVAYGLDDSETSLWSGISGPVLEYSLNRKGDA